MPSETRDIHTLSELAAAVKHYLVLHVRLAKLDAVDGAVRIATAAVLAVTVVVLTAFALVFLSMAAAIFLAPHIGLGAALCVVAAVYVAALVLCLIFKKRWIERPLVRFLAGILLKEKR